MGFREKEVVVKTHQTNPKVEGVEIVTARSIHGKIGKEVTSVRLTPFIYLKLKELAAAHNTNVATLIRTLLLFAIDQITDTDGHEK